MTARYSTAVSGTSVCRVILPSDLHRRVASGAALASARWRGGGSYLRARRSRKTIRANFLD
jgi:hypothetical protein